MNDQSVDCSSDSGEDLQDWEELPEKNLVDSEWFTAVDVLDDDE